MKTDWAESRQAANASHSEKPIKYGWKAWINSQPSITNHHNEQKSLWLISAGEDACNGLNPSMVQYGFWCYKSLIIHMNQSLLIAWVRGCDVCDNSPDDVNMLWMCISLSLMLTAWTWMSQFCKHDAGTAFALMRALWHNSNKIHLCMYTVNISRGGTTV